MSENDSMTEVVVEEATDQLDAEGLVGGDSLREQLDATEVGRAVGARLGEVAGRRIGSAIGRQVHETLADVNEETNPREFGRELASAVRDGFADALAESRERGSVLSAVTNSLQDPEIREQVANTIAGGVGRSGITESEEAEDEAAEEDEPDEAAEEAEADEAAEEAEADETESVADDESIEELDVDELDVDDLETFQAETLTEYLETISYRDLQSIAKEVGVTANITHDEMADRIVEAVTDGEDE